MQARPEMPIRLGWRFRGGAGGVKPVTNQIAEEPARRNKSFAAACVVGFAVFFSRFGIQQTLMPLIAYQITGFSVSGLGLVTPILGACHRGIGRRDGNRIALTPANGEGASEAGRRERAGP